MRGRGRVLHPEQPRGSGDSALKMPQNLPKRLKTARFWRNFARFARKKWPMKRPSWPGPGHDSAGELPAPAAHRTAQVPGLDAEPGEALKGGLRHGAHRLGGLPGCGALALGRRGV